jgi:hypothetical protein
MRTLGIESIATECNQDSSLSARIPAYLRWNAQTVMLAELLRTIATIGYRGYPSD